MTTEALEELVPLLKKRWLVPCALPARTAQRALRELGEIQDRADGAKADIPAILRVSKALSRELTPGEIPMLRKDLGTVLAFARGEG